MHEPVQWEAPPPPPRDIKKSLLVAGLGALSWVATYIGMLELIEANMGQLSLPHQLVIGFSVAMLMVMIIWLLDQMFQPIGWLTRLLYAAGYLFLTVISVGFGFGFYWKVLESKSVASTSAVAAISQVQTSLQTATTRLEQLQSTLTQLVGVSTQNAGIERDKGGTCPGSGPGDGPRRRLRDADAQRFGFAAELLKSRTGTVKGQFSALETDLVKVAGNDASLVDPKTGTRNEAMKALSRKLDMTVAGFNAFRSDPQLRQIRADLDQRAATFSFPDGRGGSFQCPDIQLQAALRGVVRAIDELPTLERQQIATVEGPEAVIEAFRRLTTTFYGALSFKLPPSTEALRELQRKAMETAAPSTSVKARALAAASLDGAGLSRRDYIPLAIAVFVDLCLLLVSIGRPRDRLANLLPKMLAAERGPVNQILTRFNQIHRDAEIRENFELFRHVVFDFNGGYYVAVPLDAPPRLNPEQREALRLEAALLANLFTSFEQEKLFARVLMPLLPTLSIRKKLRRQGSKFAEAEAFRVYKFKDGAWSEFILGAVMGAARRVETEKRRRGVEEALFATPQGPTLPMPRTAKSAAVSAEIVADAAAQAAATDAAETAEVLTAIEGGRAHEPVGGDPSSRATARGPQGGTTTRRRRFRLVDGETGDGHRGAGMTVDDPARVAASASAEDEISPGELAEIEAGLAGALRSRRSSGVERMADFEPDPQVLARELVQRYGRYARFIDPVKAVERHAPRASMTDVEVSRPPMAMLPGQPEMAARHVARATLPVSPSPIASLRAVRPPVMQGRVDGTASADMQPDDGPAGHGVAVEAVERRVSFTVPTAEALRQVERFTRAAAATSPLPAITVPRTTPPPLPAMESDAAMDATVVDAGDLGTDLVTADSDGRPELLGDDAIAHAARRFAPRTAAE